MGGGGGLALPEQPGSQCPFPASRPGQPLSTQLGGGRREGSARACILPSTLARHRRSGPRRRGWGGGRGSPSPTSPLRARPLQEVRAQHLNRKPLAPRNEGERSHTVCAVPSGVKVPFKKTMKTEKSCNDPGQLETQMGTPNLKNVIPLVAPGKPLFRVEFLLTRNGVSPVLPK